MRQQHRGITAAGCTAACEYHFPSRVRLSEAGANPASSPQSVLILATPFNGQLSHRLDRGRTARVLCRVWNKFELKEPQLFKCNPNGLVRCFPA